jgi:predicted phage tail protein
MSTPDGKVVAQYETDQFRYEFYGLNAGSYTLGVRGRNENGMKGAETQISMIIGAPPAPSSISGRLACSLQTWFQYALLQHQIPRLNSGTGENQIVNPATLKTAQFLGRSTSGPFTATSR